MRQIVLLMMRALNQLSYVFKKVKEKIEHIKQIQERYVFFKSVFLKMRKHNAWRGKCTI